MTPFLEIAIADMLPNAGSGHHCRECGFAWSTSADEALDLLHGAASRFAALLHGRDATGRASEHVWSPSAYVWHVSDAVRAWAERLHSLRAVPEVRWAGFDPDELARARRYEEAPQVTGPWAVTRSTDALGDALAGLALDTGFVHPEWGSGTVADALRWLGHEVIHHDLDVRRGLGSA